MENHRRIYVAIDLKSFYASVECTDRNLDPLTTNLVVADESRTEKTICLAVTPSLKKYGISGRSRLFEVIQKTKEINYERKRKAPGHVFTGESFDEEELARDPSLSLSYITASPRMAYYLEYSAMIYEIYLTYVSSADIHVYSIDEVFMDVTSYLETYHMTAKELANTIILDILKVTGITATVGIGTNLYLCKVAMDIVAKHIKPDKHGARIALLDEHRYRKLLWNHKPITDFWRVGRGYAKKLEEVGLYTMGDIARCSVGKPEDSYNEDLLYRLFGVNAELLIDHAWGYEPCTMEDIKAYQPSSNSIGTAQVLGCPYSFDKARLILKEMLDLLALDLVDKGLVSNQIVLTVGYDIENLKNSHQYQGEITTDYYGRKVPKHAHVSTNLGTYTSSSCHIIGAVIPSYDRVVDKQLFVRRIQITATHVMREEDVREHDNQEQLDLFTDYDALAKQKQIEGKIREKEKKLQQATINIKKKFGKNSVLKGMNLEDGATTVARNKSIGGHKA